MTQPVHHLGHAMRLSPLRDCRSVNHDDRQAQRAGSGDFGIGSGAARVFRHNQINAVFPHQRSVVRFGKRPARHKHMVIGKGWRGLGRIDETQQVEMLRVGRKLRQMHAPHGQHDALGRLIQRINGPCNVGHLGPAISVLRRPRLSGQCQQRHIRLCAGGHRIPAHLRRKGVGGVDHMCDLLGTQMLHQPINTTKTPDALWQGLTLGPVHAASKANRPVQSHFRSSVGKSRGLGRPGKDQEVGAHV